MSNLRSFASQVTIAAALVSTVSLSASADTVTYLPYPLPELAERARGALRGQGISIAVDDVQSFDDAEHAAVAIITGTTSGGTEVMVGLTQKEHGRSKVRLYTDAPDEELETRLLQNLR